MTAAEYVRLIADLLGSDPTRVRQANWELLTKLVPEEKNPDLVLVEIEDRVIRQHSTGETVGTGK